MKVAGFKILTTVLVVSAIAGCDTSQGVGRFFADKTKDNGPDEFGIVPTRPLELPADFVTLPEPTPGARNRTDPLPDHDAVAALGGQPSRLDSTSVPSSENALLSAATRNGTTTNIREVLKQEDEAFRDDNGPRLLERLFKVNTYLRTYEDQTLKARKVNEQLRRNGLKTPTVSPESDR